MRNPLPVLVLALLSTPVSAASLTFSALLDEDGSALDLDGSLPLTDAWLVGAGAGRSDLSVDGEEFRASSVRASTDVQFGGMFANAAAERWRDSGQLEATTLRAGLGWMAPSGLTLSVLAVDRGLDIEYTATVDGETRQRTFELDGNGLGAEVAWLDPDWSIGMRYVEYDYGRNVDRLRAILESAETERFPRLQRLITSVATRAASAPDREIALLVARRFGRSQLSGDWQLQREAVTGEYFNSVGITLGLELGTRWMLDTMAGFNRGDSSSSTAWGGLALTLRSPAASP
jgi:hypothetical protein